MRVRQIYMRNVMSHADSTIELPERGIVVVTGSNGAGKSSIVETVALAGWGKTLRGSAAWNQEASECLASVLAEGIDIKRQRKKSRVALEWAVVDDGSETGRLFDSLIRLGAPGLSEAGVSARDGAAPPNFESNTQAQEALERLIGPFDVWRRANAFSSSDAAHFSMATDAERKRLLESILGLGRFDVALEDCRSDLKAATMKGAQLRRAAEVQRETLAGERRRLADAEAAAARARADLPDALPSPPDGELARLRSAIARTTEDIKTRDASLREADERVGQAEGWVQQAHKAVHRVAVDHCPVCSQAITLDVRARAEEHLAKAREEATHEREEAARAREALEAERVELREELSVLNTKLSQVLAQARAAEERAEARRRAELARATAERDVAAARSRVKGLVAKLAEAEAEAVEAEKKTAVLQAVEVVLGLRGVRAHVLARSLSGIEAVTNVWLGRLGLGEVVEGPDALQVADAIERLGGRAVSLKLKPYSEKKGGGVADAISIEVAGAGGGHGYKGASAGERRRIDLALLLGISEVAAAAAGRPAGTLFFDELFDALDRQGVQAVSEALVELAKDRCVVVITHSAELAGWLPAVKRIRVTDGKVVVQ